MTGPAPSFTSRPSPARRSLKRFAVALTVCLLSGAPSLAAPSKAAVEQQFQSWLAKDLWPEAKASGISRNAFDQAVAGLKLNWDLPDLVPPGTAPPKEQ